MKIEGFGIAGGDLKELLEHIKKDLEGGATNTVPGFFGIEEAKYDQWIKDILVDCIQMDKKTDVIGKHFSNVDAETRAKIFAYHVAMTKFRKVDC